MPVAAPIARLSALNATALRVEWDALPASQARGTVTRYQVSYRRHVDPTSERDAEVGAGVRRYVLTGERIYQNLVVFFVLASNIKYFHIFQSFLQD